MGDEPCVQPARGGKAKQRPKYVDVDLVRDVQEMSASDVYVLSDENSDDEEVVMSA